MKNSVKQISHKFSFLRLELSSVINFLLLICVFLFAFGSHKSQAEILQGIHVVATGNNKYESKIRANDDGMTQAVSLISDKWGIKNAFFEHVSYKELKSVFSIDSVIKEASYDEKYTADVNYSYSNFGIHEFILKHATEEVKKQFLNYIIIPVFKQKDRVSFLDTKTEWLATWIDSIEQCKKYRLLPIDPTKDAVGIDPSNIFSMSYINFLDKLKVKRFKNILVAICEYFTRDDGSMYFKMTIEEITPTGKNVTDIKYDISDPEHARDYFDVAIDTIVNKYGEGNNNENNSKNTMDIAYASEKMMIDNVHTNKKAGSILDVLLNAPKIGRKLTKIDMKLDVFSSEELKGIKDKLNNIKEVIKYKIDIDDGGYYKMSLYTDVSMDILSESFYNHNLSYKFYDNQYVMFELESGI